MRLHIVPYLGAIRVRDLSAEVIDGWLGDLSSPDSQGAKRLGSTSTRLVRKILSMAMEEAVQRGRLSRNPVARTQPPRRDRSRQKLGWTLDEARSFLVAASDHRLAAAFHLSLVTGLRRDTWSGWVPQWFESCPVRPAWSASLWGLSPTRSTSMPRSSNLCTIASSVATADESQTWASVRSMTTRGAASL